LTHLESEIVKLNKTIDGHKRTLKDKHLYIENLEREVCRLPVLVGRVSELTDENRNLQELCSSYREHLNELRERMPYSPPIPDLQAEEMQGERHVWINEDALGTNYGMMAILIVLYPFKLAYELLVKVCKAIIYVTSIATWPIRAAMAMPMRIIGFISKKQAKIPPRPRQPQMQ
jgi:hypothetical protein